MSAEAKPRRELRCSRIAAAPLVAFLATAEDGFGTTMEESTSMMPSVAAQ